MKYVILTPWKISASSPLSDFCREFLGRLEKQVTIQWITPSGSLASEEKIEQFLVKEARKLKENGFRLCCLDEQGKQYSSTEFSRLLEKYEVQSFSGLAFCFGGAYGLPAQLAQIQPIELFSLTRFTLQHELALAVFLEQLYRARCILTGHPYHHGEKSPMVKALNK